ncbi:hypothetical protein K1T71_013517 [Dendrolimus kikuchii]|uniref:Uncharacterized protein n=1 Tax=Dendrolimus kikuchii TaxID=765133 RepID=A0ACC1CGN6_9NEOP|nr:hypothetical protein K1T71_013517 [Dendrolimus kikuchii]
MSNFESPIPLSEIESVLAWVDTFKLSRATKKINRDFSDAVLLAEILNVYYPKLVEMHNYPPRNSHSLKLNNWMTLNRKVLKKLKLNLCLNTMEQLANCAPGVIERVLVMVREKIRRDEELNKSTKDAEQNVSSGGSYYEACGDDEHVLVVPLKTRVNGVLETIQQKVVSYDSYQTLKVQLKDATDATEVLKQKVEHLDNLLKLKDERIEELQKQLERKQSRRKEVEALQNSLAVPFETIQSPANITENIIPLVKSVSLKNIDSKTSKLEEKVTKEESKESRIPVLKVESSRLSKPSLTEVSDIDLKKASIKDIPKANSESKTDVDKIKSEVFKEIEIIDERTYFVQDYEEFKDSEQGGIVTIEETIQKEIKDITTPIEYAQDFSYVN